MANGSSPCPAVEKLRLDFRFDETLNEIDVHSNFGLRLSLAVALMDDDNGATLLQAYTVCCEDLILLDGSYRCSSCYKKSGLTRDWVYTADTQSVVDEILNMVEIDPLERTVVACEVNSRIVEVSDYMKSAILENGLSKKLNRELEYYCEDISGKIVS